MNENRRQGKTYSQPRYQPGRSSADFAPMPSLEGIPSRNHFICSMCRNSLREVCVEQCAPEGKYQKLDPKPLDEIPFLPRLPNYSQTVNGWSGSEKWALTYLVMFYLLADRQDEG